MATVIGTRTAGNVLGAQNFNVGDDYFLPIPVFGWFAWTVGNLDGIGVEPDFKVEIDEFSLGENIDAQFGRAVEVLNS